MTTAEQRVQRDTARAKGNRIRKYRSEVKRDVARGVMRPELVFAVRDEMLDGMAVEEYLRSVPGLGPAKVLQARHHVNISSDTPFANLNERQRTWMIMWLHDHVEQSARYHNAVERFQQAVA